MTATILTQQTLKELLHYDPETGVFTYLHRDRRWFKSDQSRNAWNAKFSGKVAGSLDQKGYRRIRVPGARYRSHRMAFLYITGSFPPDQMDHINREKDDNRWVNLRAVTNMENHKNKPIPKNNTSGTVGVCWDKARKQWVAQIKAEGKAICLGHFEDFEDAAATRKAAEVKYGFHPNHGKGAHYNPSSGR